MKKSSTKNLLTTIVLSFEIVVIFLAGLTLFGLKAVEPPYMAILFSLVTITLAIIAILLIRKSNLGIIIGHFLHVAYFIPTIFLPPIALVAAMFGGLWLFALYKGREVDRLRNSYESKMSPQTEVSRFSDKI